ncbi:MAG: aldo/keto reductase [Candidatus Riflebacteria bacterium HGW-Riflebacteria-1]|jgi:aryl-alcohol dehydrogenase-like predicted oxidoreductase/NAD-dependent dihydropyrimidine dehydrogenase PreA subunit|nr:MAG: aldo/keto reductase [Candidatus Riflebacteria bacterium HGW-Riflebacteria-1]
MARKLLELAMKKQQLGKTAIEVSLLGIGTLTMSPMQRDLSLADGAAVILHALAQGITLIDTAQMYGSYPQVAAALSQWKGPAPVVASKSAARTREAMQAAVEECLKQTGLSHIDVFLLHAVRDAADIAARSAALQYLREARERGLVKAIGASSHSALTVDLLANTAGIEVLHPMYNRDGIGILDASLAEMTDILKRARARGIGIYAMKPLGGGHLRNDAAAALHWIFASQVVDSAVVGMTSSDEVDMNVALVKDEPVDEGFARKVAGRERRLFINAGLCQNCNACVEACQQQALRPGEKTPAIDHESCILCGYCAPVCPKFAIRII